MPLVIADRVRETTTTSGTGTLTLAGPYSGFQAFSVIGNGNTTYYAIIDAQNGAWEVGIGAYTSSGNTLSRATVLASSNAGSLVNFGTGTKDVILTQPARRSVLVQEGGSGLITGVAAFTANGVPYADSTSTLATSANMTFNGTRLTVADLADSGLTAGRVVYVGSGSALVDSANLTFDGTNLTLGGGTANGVAYLNGSKVLTTGSALTFDGTLLRSSTYLGLSTNTTPDTSTGDAIFYKASAGATLSGFNLVFETGSAGSRSEQMRLTSTGLGIGTSSPGSKLAVTGAAGTGSIAVLTNSTATSTTTFANPILKLISGASGADSSIQFTDNITANGYVSWKNSTLNFSTNSGINHMMLDSSGNLGIGTSSPAAKLDVAGASDSDNVIRASTNSSNGIIIIRPDGANGNVLRWGGNGANANTFRFVSGGDLERMRIDSSGNLGLGVTPSAWISSWKVLEQAGVSLASSSTAGVVGQNWWINSSGSDIYRTTAAASIYRQTAGAHSWFTAPSGTAGNAISFTQAMTLDASGNFMVGATSPSFSASSRGNITVGGSGSAILALQTGGTAKGYVFHDGTEMTIANEANGFLRFYTNATERARIAAAGWFRLTGPYMSFGDNGYIRADSTGWFQVQGGSNGSRFMDSGNGSALMTLDASGQLGLGTTSPNKTAIGRALTVNGSANAGLELAAGDVCYGLIFANSSRFSLDTNNSGANIINFYTSNTERARIDSSGNLLVGATASTYHTFLKNTNNDWCTAVINTASSTPQGLLIRYTGASPNNTGSTFLLGLDSGNTTRFAFYSNGGLANFSGNNVNLSDRREKTNFAPAKSYLETICAIPVQTFNYVDQNMEEDPGLTLGVVAQDVQAVAPELVMESNWGTKEEPKMRLSIYQTDLQYALMKCIQEQQALIQTLTARVAALESTP
jgi:hypothetical protein